MYAVVGSCTAYLAAMVADAERDRRRKDRWIQAARSLLPLERPRSQNPLKHSWDSLRPSQRTMATLIGLNGAVFAAWRVPSLRSFMSRYFLHSTTSHPITLLTSVFSHESVTHFAFNMFALWSFGTLLHEKMGREQFLAFYLTSGMAASLGSHAYKLYRWDSARSLGASGALFGVVGACAHLPNINLSLIFVPVYSAPLDKALPVIMAIDLVGMLRGWRALDHAAHFAGAAFGYSFYTVSMDHIWRHRRSLLLRLNYPIR